MVLLSISIPTYNRSALLKELVESILSVDSKELEVVVTNNCSTDETLEMLAQIEDSRLKVFTNSEPISAFCNMLTGLFNASGKYVMHCNDRDIVHVERLLDLINFLRNEDYSAVSTTRSNGAPSFRVIRYKKGFDSLMNLPLTYHPTGLIFNRQLMGKYLRKEDYKQYVKALELYSFLQKDLLVYEKSAVYDNSLWNERPAKVSKKRLRSGTCNKSNLFFEPEVKVAIMNGIIDQVVGNPHFSLSREQEHQFFIRVIKYFKRNLIQKKLYYANVDECAHYGIQPHYVGCCAMHKAYKFYVQCCTETIKRKGFALELDVEWKKLSSSITRSVVSDCFHADIIILKKNIRLNYPRIYRYLRIFS